VHHTTLRLALAIALWSALFASLAHSNTPDSLQDATGQADHSDPVIARLYEHLGSGPRPIVLAVGPGHFPPPVWNRVKHLVAFRIHRHRDDGTTAADAAIYLVRDSAIYAKAAEAARHRSTHHEYIWCLLAAVILHESAHTEPKTERQALLTEAAQLRRCLFEGHLYAGDGWSAVGYLGKVEAKLRHPREHY
jgi:hypothetical protein